MLHDVLTMSIQAFLQRVPIRVLHRLGQPSPINWVDGQSVRLLVTNCLYEIFETAQKFVRGMQNRNTVCADAMPPYELRQDLL